MMNNRVMSFGFIERLRGAILANTSEIVSGKYVH